MKKAETEVRNSIFIEGSLGVLITAPHSKPHLRKSLTQIRRDGEKRTDFIAQSIAQLSGASILLPMNTDLYDPNWGPVESNPFLKELDAVLKNNQYGFHIDIHGLDKKSLIDIQIGYYSRFGKSAKLAKLLKKALKKGALKEANIQLFYLQESGNKNMINKVVQLNNSTASMQLEIGQYIREDSELIDCIISCITEFVTVNAPVK